MGTSEETLFFANTYRLALQASLRKSGENVRSVGLTLHYVCMEMLEPGDALFSRGKLKGKRLRLRK